jgi:hypothetical protein
MTFEGLILSTPVQQDGLHVRYYDGGSVRCVEGWDDKAPATKAHLLRASGRSSEGATEIVLERHAILRYTPCGVWIDTWKGDKYVNLRAGKQWASTSEAEAIDQLYHRKRAQVRILRTQLADAEAVQAAMEKHLGKKAPLRRWNHNADYY